MKATRDSFGDALASLGAEHSAIVVLDADLSKSTKSEKFAKKFPERFFEMGIAEANMLGTAAGLALAGKIPFACSFGCFITGRYDQIRMSISYNQANVKIVGTHAGVAIGEDGHSQMGLEDVAMIRSLPNLAIYQPADDVETQSLMKKIISENRPCYLRLTRQKLPTVHSSDYVFEPGVWPVLRRGKKVALIATGALVESCLKADDERGKNWTVVNASTLKPVDEKLLDELSKTHEMIVTAEDHYTIGGLGSAVTEVISQWGRPIRVFRIGVEKFGESGTPEALYRSFQLDSAGILQRLDKLFGQKAS